MALKVLMKIKCFSIVLLILIIVEFSNSYVTSEFDSSLGSDIGRPKMREKRYLVYPDGGPARSQFIIGLGVPTESEEQAVTVGIVIKFQYDLPSNSTEYTERIFDYAQLVSSRGWTKVEKSEEIEVKDQNNTPQGSRKGETLSDADVDDAITVSYEELETTTENDIIDIEFDDKLNQRNSASSINLGNDENSKKVKRFVKNSESMSLQEAIEDQERRDALRDKEASKMKTNRWDLYKMIEHFAGRYGMGGRACMLRTVCEAAETPFTHQNGLLGEIVHILFTPSSTRDPVSMHADHEYHAAERLGRESGGDCARLFPECESSMLDAFTQVGLDTMHRFTSF